MAQTKNKLKYQIYLSFFLALFCLLFFPAFFFLKLIYFAPFLIISFYNSSFVKVLWLSILCGIFSDVLATSSFGVISLSYLSASCFLYREKRFFNDKPVNLSIFTGLYSIVFSIFNLLFLFIFDKTVIISFKWTLSDLLIMPVFDGIYAFLWFSLPFLVIEKIKRTNFKTIWTFCKIKIFRLSR